MGSWVRRGGALLLVVVTTTGGPKARPDGVSAGFTSLPAPDVAGAGLYNRPPCPGISRSWVRPWPRASRGDCASSELLPSASPLRPSISRSWGRPWPRASRGAFASLELLPSASSPPGRCPPRPLQTLRISCRPWRRSAGCRHQLVHFTSLSAPKQRRGVASLHLLPFPRHFEASCS